MSKRRVVIVGAGGQARELAYYLEDLNREGDSFDMVGFVVSDLSILGPRDSRERVVGDFAWLDTHRRDVDGILLGVGMPRARMRLSGEIVRNFPELEWPSVVHPTARWDGSSCQFGRGVMIGPSVTLTVNVRVDEFAMLNFGCTVGHETRVGKASVINPGANISGGVQIGDRVMVGAGAVVLQYLSVGDEATVGAGAVVTHDVPAGITVVGVPARPMVKPGPT